MTTTFELNTQYDSAKSFYKKATVRKEFTGTMTIYTLTSYTTEVAEVQQNGNGDFTVASVFGTHSATTLRHIKEFLKQYGFKADTKAQIEKDYFQLDFNRKGIMFNRHN